MNNGKIDVEGWVIFIATAFLGGIVYGFFIMAFGLISMNQHSNGLIGFIFWFVLTMGTATAVVRARDNWIAKNNSKEVQE